MRKIAILVCALLMLSLCSCAADPYAQYDYIDEMLANGDYAGAIAAIQQLSGANSGTSDPTGSSQYGPTPAEQNMLREYSTIARALEDYTEDGYINIYSSEDKKNLTGSAALAYCCKALSEMESIDKWLAEGEWIDMAIPADREKLLKGFEVVSDVLLQQDSTLTDNMGNVTVSEATVLWNYNGDESVASIEGVENLWEFYSYAGFWGGTCTYNYDLDGSIISMQVTSGSSVVAVITPAYDENGRLVSEYVQTNSGDYSRRYTYNNDGRVEKISWQASTKETQKLLYAYDSEGRLVKETLEVYDQELGFTSDSQTWEYTYDSNGYLSEATYTAQTFIWGQPPKLYSQRTNHVQYECDDQGRIVKQTVTVGKTEISGGEETAPQYAKEVVERIYGDYYLYYEVK